jgi:hypothetical protein
MVLGCNRASSRFVFQESLPAETGSPPSPARPRPTQRRPPSRDRTAARKETEKITKVLKECQAWEQDALQPLTQQRIELDLDDGVKVNYLKLQDVLATIPGLAAKEG